MIEMQWVRLITDSKDYAAQNHRYKHATNLGGFACVLQFREVIKDPYSKFETATEWQDVKIGEST